MFYHKKLLAEILCILLQNNTLYISTNIIENPTNHLDSVMDSRPLTCSCVTALGNPRAFDWVWHQDSIAKWRSFGTNGHSSWYLSVPKGSIMGLLIR